MALSRWICALLAPAALIGAPATAADYLDTVVSPVFQADGDHAALATRAAMCLAKNGGTPGQNIQSDPAGGTIVGGALFSYSWGGVPWSVRSTLTVETKDGRFRVTHSSLTRKQGGPAAANAGSWLFRGSVDQKAEGGWDRIGKWRMSGSEKVEAAAQVLSQTIATCIATRSSDNW